MYQEEQDELLYKEAKKNVKKKKGFYGHLSAYISTGIFFLLINIFISGAEDLWFFMPMIPWGLALSIHYFSVFGLPFTKGVLTKDWENEELEKELSKLKGKYGSRRAENRYEKPESLELPELEKRKNYNDEDFV